MSYQNEARGMLSDYMNIRTLPAILSVAYLLASLYQFGGISQVTLTWLGGGSGYSLTATHALMISLGTFAIAFASSETKQFENYERWEQVLIAVGPIVIVGQQYMPALDDLLLQLGDPLGYQLAFLATALSWAVAVR